MASTPTCRPGRPGIRRACRRSSSNRTRLARPVSGSCRDCSDSCASSWRSSLTARYCRASTARSSTSPTTSTGPDLSVGLLGRDGQPGEHQRYERQPDRHLSRRLVADLLIEGRPGTLGDADGDQPTLRAAAAPHRKHQERHTQRDREHEIGRTGKRRPRALPKPQLLVGPQRLPHRRPGKKGSPIPPRRPAPCPGPTAPRERRGLRRPPRRELTRCR